MNHSIPTPTMLLLRIESLEARIRLLEQQLLERGAASHEASNTPLGTSVLAPLGQEAHWVVGNPAGSAKVVPLRTQKARDTGVNSCGK